MGHHRAAGDAEAAIAAIAAQQQRERDERTETESMLMLIDSMDKDALEAYAPGHEVNLDKRRGRQAARRGRA